MTTFIAPQLRRWADDMEQHFSTTSRIGVVIKAEAHAHRMRARADLMDAQNGEYTGVADTAQMVYHLPIVGQVIVEGGKMISIERPYNGEGECVGIHTAWEWNSDPTAEEQTGSLCRLYIGTEQDGPVAMFDAERGQWHQLTSRGNFGKRYACGGNFYSKKITETPEIINQLEAIMEKNEAIKKAELRLQAANKRVLAAHQMENAAAHDRQAMNPIYAGQEVVCMGKAETIRAYANKTLAEAELLEAQAI